MKLRESLIREHVAAFDILGKDAVRNVVGHRAQDIALEGQLFLRLGVQRDNPVEPPRRVISAHYRGEGSHTNRHGLMLRGIQGREEEMFQSYKYG